MHIYLFGALFLRMPMPMPSLPPMAICLVYSCIYVYSTLLYSTLLYSTLLYSNYILDGLDPDMCAAYLGSYIHM